MSSTHLDFESDDPLALVETCYNLARDYQQGRNNRYKRYDQQYRGYLDTRGRDLNLSNIFLPKLFSAVETKVPRDVSAILGTRPYIPCEARREEFAQTAELLTDFHDEVLCRAGILEKLVQAFKIKYIHGTSFIEALPYFEDGFEKQVVPQIAYGMQVGQEIVEVPVQRYSLDVRVYAPWEIYVDPHARNLSDQDGCRYALICQLVSRRDLIRMAQQGAYGADFDIEALMAGPSAESEKKADHVGLQMMADMGLPVDLSDDDMGVLLRFQSRDRYIDSYNGRILLRDGPNPFKHKRINICRIVNIPDPNPQSSFWGIGDAEMGELLCDLLNDTWDMTFDSHQQATQPVIYYRTGAVSPDSLVRIPGNRIGVSDQYQPDRPISDIVQESPGQSLPRDHYMLPEVIEGMLDLVWGQHEVSRGESTKGSETLGEVAMLKEGDETRQELNVRMVESFLNDFGRKIFYHAEQFARPEDFAEVLGPDKATYLQVATPFDIPGGFNFAYKGSDRVVNQLRRQRTVKELLPVLMQIGALLPGESTRWALEEFEVPRHRIEQMCLSDQEMFAMQQQQMMAQQAQQEQGRAREDQLTQAKYKDHTGAEEARETGQQAGMV